MSRASPSTIRIAGLVGGLLAACSPGPPALVVGAQPVALGALRAVPEGGPWLLTASAGALDLRVRVFDADGVETSSTSRAQDPRGAEVLVLEPRRAARLVVEAVRREGARGPLETGGTSATLTLEPAPPALVALDAALTPVEREHTRPSRATLEARVAALPPPGVSPGAGLAGDDDPRWAALAVHLATQAARLERRAGAVDAARRRLVEAASLGARTSTAIELRRQLAVLELDADREDPTRVVGPLEALRPQVTRDDLLLFADLATLRARLVIDRDTPAAAIADLEALRAPLGRLAPSTTLATLELQLGWAHVRRGDRRAAEATFARAHVEAEGAGSPSLRAAALHALGAIEADFDGDWAEALPYHLRAIEILEGIGEVGALAYSLDAAGEMESTLGDARAIDRHLRALELRRRVGSLRGEAQTWISLGSAYTRLGRADEAIEPLLRGAAMMRRLGDLTWEAYAHYRVGRAEAVRGRYAAALEWAVRALEPVESLRERVATDDGRAYYTASVRIYYDLAVLAAARAGRVDAAFAWAERARARALADMVALLGDAVDAPPSVAERRRAARALELERRRLVAEGAPEAQQIAIAAEVDAALAAYEAEVAALPARTTGLLAAPTATLDEVRRALPEGTLVLELHLGRQGSVALAVASSTVVVAPLPALDGLSTPARALHAALSARNVRVADETLEARQARVADADRAVETESARLGGLVLGPIGALLDTHPRLVVVADGALHYVPFGVLRDPRSGRRLVETHVVSTAPSLTVLLGLERRAHAAPREGVFVGVGDVLTGPDDPRLHGAADPVDAPADAPGASADAPTRDGVPARAQLATRLPAAARELRALARRLPTARRRMLTGAEARRDVLLGGALADARWIHVATHGVLDTREPERSGLVLSPVDAAGRPVEGFLSLADVYGLRLRAELVTLSACETALGAEVHGEGLVGLTRGFLYAGAEQVIASLWKVSDDATAELMRGLYDALLDGGRPAADALTAAQRALAAAGRPAYAWAPFTLTGGLVGLDVARRSGADPLSAASRAGPARRSRSTSGPRSR